MAAFDAEAVLKQQQEACTKFFRDNLPKDVLKPMPEEKRPENTKKFKGPVYDITGFDAVNVVALLSDIVNDKDQFRTNKTFYLLLQNSHGSKPDDKIEELFRLKARPTKNQPGNGIVFLRPRRKKLFTQDARKYDELEGVLKAHYKDTKTFAQDIKNLFQNNSVVTDDFPQASNFTGLSTQIFLSRIVNLGKFQTALSVSIQREISSQLDIWMYLHAQTCIPSGLEVIT